MPVDGVFIHFLIAEIYPQIVNERIHKFQTLNQSEFLLNLSNKKQVFMSLNGVNPHLRLTNLDLINQPSPLSSFLRKHIEGSIIRNLYQYESDRLITFALDKADELGYTHRLYMIVELFGHKSNLIFTDDNFLILAAHKKSFLDEERFIQVKAKYTYPQTNKYNPFLLNEIKDPLLGVSNMLQEEINYRGDINFLKTIEVAASYFTWDNKSQFYAFPLTYLNALIKSFPSLSSLLEYVEALRTNQAIESSDKRRINVIITKEIKKLQKKKQKQMDELSQAQDNLNLEKTANILASNIHLVKPYQSEILVNDFYNNTEVVIKLNPQLSPSENLNNLYTKFKKAKRTILALTKTLKQTDEEILYYTTLLTQSEMANTFDLKEITEELIPPKHQQKNAKPHYLTFRDHFNNLYFVGKNNTQNNYLTNTLAKKDDYFFHVKNYPGAHIIFRGELDDEAIINAANLACIYSKMTSKTAVDYTLIKWVKKIKNKPGSFVTYTKEKQIVVSGNHEVIKKNLQQI